MNTSKKDKMFALVEQWRESGLKRKAFSALHGINGRSFEYWCKKQLVQAPEPFNGHEFIELGQESSVGEKSAIPRIEIELAGGVVIKIY